MAKNRFLYLRNDVSRDNGFQKARNVNGNKGAEAEEDDEEIVMSTTPNANHQSRLRISRGIFQRQRAARAEARSLPVPAVIDLIIIKFFKTFDKKLTNTFLQNYGLFPSTYADFNKTVLFEITDEKRFASFLNHLELFYSSDTLKSYEGQVYSLIALVNNFEFLSADKRIESEIIEVSSFSIIPIQSRKSLSIQEALLTYLNDKGLEYSQSRITPEVLFVSNIDPISVREIVENFDVVKNVVSTRTERRRPGVYGEVRRDYGFRVTVDDDLPVVGIIDSGMHRVDPLSELIVKPNYDLTNNGSFWDELGHGTAVASLVALGSDFVRNVRDNYNAKAKIMVIKALHEDNDNINIVQLVETIVTAHKNHGVRLFNLSLNDPMHKAYNEAVSDYAYMLDKIAYENDILIFISVGNIAEQRLRELVVDEPHELHSYPTLHYSPNASSDIHVCESTNIAKPSESFNNLSIGALAGNLEGGLTSDISPSEELPAYYTRKFHYDFDRLVNGAPFLRSQKNKYLNKPDLVFEGGDLFVYESGMEVIRSPLGPDNRFYSRSCGTSLATPLVTSLAAQIMKAYPELRTQSIKALLINTAEHSGGKNPAIFRPFTRAKLLRKMSGFGRPDPELILGTGSNSVTFVIESEIGMEDFQTIPINIPTYLQATGNKLNIRATLSYSFLPTKDNHLAYLPIQITFGIFKPLSAENMSGMFTKDYVVKNGMSWSDDFFGVDNRLFSNVQQIEYNVSGDQIAECDNAFSIAVKCTRKNNLPTDQIQHLAGKLHDFSLVLTLTELPHGTASNRLYEEIVNVNEVDLIGDLNADLDAEF